MNSYSSKPLHEVYDDFAQWFACVALFFALVHVAAGDDMPKLLSGFFSGLSVYALCRAACARPAIDTAPKK